MLNFFRIPSIFLILALLSPAIPLADLSHAPATLSKCLEYLGSAARWEIRDPGPWMWLPAPRAGTRAIETITDLKVAQYNIENLFNSRGKKVFSRSQNRMITVIPPNAKPLENQLKLKEVIERADPDIMVWEEVEDAYAAQDFVEKHLGGRYRVILIEGNDKRGIDVAVLLKRDLPFDVEVQSHRELKNVNGSRKQFSRDFLLTSFYAPKAAKIDAPLFELGGVHLKSQRDSSGDPRSVARRKDEVDAVTRITRFRQRMYPETPMFLLGDFNADLRSAPEFQGLWDDRFHDALGLGATPVPSDRRITQSYHPFNGPTSYSQLDGTLVNEVTRRDDLVKNAAIIPYLLPDGTPRPYARSILERDQQGSDHWMVQMTLDFQKTLSLWQARRAGQTATSAPLLH